MSVKFKLGTQVSHMGGGGGTFFLLLLQGHWVYQRSTTENIVTMLSWRAYWFSSEFKVNWGQQETVRTFYTWEFDKSNSVRRLGSYLVCRYILVGSISLLTLVEIQGHLKSKTEKVNTETWRAKLFLVCWSLSVSTRSLLIFVEIQGHLSSTLKTS